MTDYLDVLKKINDAIKNSKEFDQTKNEMISGFVETARQSILTNISKSGDATDNNSASAFIACMSMISLYFYQLNIDKEFRKLYFEPTENSIEYGRSLYKKLVGVKN